MRFLRCENCIHNEVCFLQEVCEDIEEQLDEFGCENFKEVKNMCKFRDLRADEIDVRVAMCKENGCSLLLYKDARCDMNILDETVGATNWQRQHTRDNANCIVSIWDEDKKQWISKEDTGTESMTEKEKGQASDSFKRACFNWGIGRELYTSPFIWIKSEDVKIIKRPNGTFATNDKFAVEKIKIENKKITALSIVNVTQKKRVFVMMPKEKGE